MSQDAHEGSERQAKDKKHGSLKMYLRFAAMILTGMVVMYWTMFAGVWDGDTSASARAAYSWLSPWAAPWASLCSPGC